jgi:superfamily I DNA/RNA helicase
MKWMVREDKLDPSQRAFWENFYRSKKNVWIKGFPGSGKSVLVVYTLRNILAKEPRAKICVVVFTRSLIELFKVGIKELGINSSIQILTYIQFVEKSFGTYDYILCDEVQDLPERVLQKMKQVSKRVIVAGDFNQSIYDQDPRYFQPPVSPSLIGKILDAEEYELQYLHRLSKSIIKAIQKLVPNMKINENKRDLTKQDNKIKICKANTEAEELKYIYDEGLDLLSNDESVAILLPTSNAIMKFINLLLGSLNKKQWTYVSNNFNRPDYDDLNFHLEQNNVKIQYIGSGYGSLNDVENNKQIVLMTYHSAKGLDFDNVFLPFFNSAFYLQPEKANTLLMVAMTRCKKQLYFTYTGMPSRFLSIFKEESSEISIDDITSDSGDKKIDIKFDFDF